MMLCFAMKFKQTHLFMQNSNIKEKHINKTKRLAIIYNSDAFLLKTIYKH